MIKSVAVVDDSDEFQHLAMVMFSYLGIEDVTVWNDSVKALKDIGSAPPDVVLLDVMMAGMSGLDVWSRLRENEHTKTLPIIVCTAAINRIIEHERKLHEDKNTYLLPKPFTLDDIRKALEYLKLEWE